MEYIDKPSIEAELAAEVLQVSTTPNWQSSIIYYLVNGTLPTERLEFRKLQIKVAHNYMWSDILFRRSYNEPYLRCLMPPDALSSGTIRCFTLGCLSLGTNVSDYFTNECLTSKNKQVFWRNREGFEVFPSKLEVRRPTK
ncbi:hypothetical protein ACFX2C_044571 [Malus domestica]